jgi:septal ring factor EnvC (AmiA/AmiB activator)
MKTPFQFFLVYFIVFMSFLSSGVSGETKRKVEREKIKLEDVTRKIRQKKKEIKKAEKQEAQVIKKLNKIEKQLLKENKEYKKVNKNIGKIQNEIRNSQIKIQKLKKQAEKKELYLKKRLSALYKYYRRSGIRILMSSATYNDFLKMEKSLAGIVSNDYALLKECLETLEESKKYQKEQSNKKAELVKIKKNLQKKRSTIKQTRKDKVGFLQKIKREKSLQIKALKELEEYSKELQNFVDRLPHKKRKFLPSGIRFSRMKGKLEFPVNGKIISTFGKKEYPELNTFTFQKGIEIKAPIGTEIRAIHDGRVVFADWFKGYGYMIIIDHGDNYYSLSAHASELFKKVDDIVAPGETIALVGDTSSMIGSCLYFEIRYHGKPQNPLKWLKRGGNKT